MQSQHANVHYSLIYDQRLSPMAFKLLVYFLLCPKDKEPISYELISDLVFMREGQVVFYCDELKRNGYLQIKKAGRCQYRDMPVYSFTLTPKAFGHE